MFPCYAIILTNKRGVKMSYQEICNYAKKVRKIIHANPEIGFECYKTSSLVVQELEKFQFKVYPGFSKTGVIGEFIVNPNYPTIAFRADMDALAIKELHSCNFKSTNDYMHACGHDIHTAILLGTCCYVFIHAKELKVNVKVIFQPAEEGPLPGGALGMIDSKLLNSLTRIYAYHVTNKIEVGKIGIKYQQAMAAPDLFEITLNGQGCHASSPSLGKNPNLPLAKIVLEFEELSKKINHEKKVVISSTILQSGQVINIIPEKGLIKGTIRCLENETRDEVTSCMKSIVEKVCREYNISHEFQMNRGYDPLINDIDACNTMKICGEKALGKDQVILLENPEMVGEDFSYYLKQTKGCLIWLGSKKAEDPFFDLHSPYFFADEDVIETGLKLNIELLNYNEKSTE